jgi:hypothetical protein
VGPEMKVGTSDIGKDVKRGAAILERSEGRGK